MAFFNDSIVEEFNKKERNGVIDGSSENIFKLITREELRKLFPDSLIQCCFLEEVLASSIVW